MTPAQLRGSFFVGRSRMMLVSSTQAWLLIALMGAVGTMCRYALGRWILGFTGGSFPWGTFAVNAIGCLLIGVIAGGIEKEALVSPAVPLAIILGFLGGLTTFSSLALVGYS